MPEIDDLPEILLADVSDDDFLPIFDNSASSSPTRKISRANLLSDVAREGGDHDFGTVEIADFTATDGTVIDLTVTTSLAFDSAATLQKMYRAAASITFGDLTSSAGQTVTTAIAGIAVGDYISLSFGAALPDGLIIQAWTSATNTVSVRAYNATDSTISGASYTAKIAVMRFT